MVDTVKGLSILIAGNPGGFELLSGFSDRTFPLSDRHIGITLH